MKKGENALTVEVFIIIVKFILHIVCVLSYGKVYERNNIFDKKSQYMIFHVLSAVKSGEIVTFRKTIDFQNFHLGYSNGFDHFGKLLPWGYWGLP